MFKGKPVLAIVPARGGSKGIPGKNLRKLGKDTLLERALKLGLACKRVDKTVVTTNDKEMYAIAECHGVAAPTLRPEYLAQADSRTIDVVLHLLEQLKFEDGYVLLLQPTAPFRTLADLDALLDTFEKSDDAAAITSLCRTDEPHPLKLQAVREKWVEPYMEGGDGGAPRQTLPPVYRLNGAFYFVSVATLKQHKKFLPPKTLPFIMPPERSINLDGMFDWYLAEMLVEKKLVPFEEYN